MQTQLERAAIGGVRATENYSFRPVHKAPKKSLQKTLWWVAHCKPFTCSWQVCSQEQHTKVTSILSCSCKFTASRATPHSEFANESCVSESLTGTHLPKPGCYSLSSMSCCYGSLAAKCRNAWNVSVSRYFRDPSLGNVCTFHRSSPPAHSPSETVT